MSLFSVFIFNIIETMRFPHLLGLKIVANQTKQAMLLFSITCFQGSSFIEKTLFSDMKFQFENQFYSGIIEFYSKNISFSDITDVFR